MAEPNLKQALSYQRSAFQWLTLAQCNHSPAQRQEMLALAHEWLEMAHEAFGDELRSTVPTAH
jgi:hypothetical protein